MVKADKLGEAVKRYGYAKEMKIKLYDKHLELVSDPVNPQDEDVFVDAREEGTECIRQVQVPQMWCKWRRVGSRRKTKANLRKMSL